MPDELASLLAARGGHFRFASGHHGDVCLELPRLYLRPEPARRLAAALARRIAPHNVETVCGPLVEGAFVALLVAEELRAEFAYADRIEHPERDGLFPVEYRLPEPLRPPVRGRRVAIVDDVVNAGSATRGTFAELRSCGAEPVAIGALLVLGASAERLAADERVALATLARRESNLWAPDACPLCAAGEPLEHLVG